jgi:hypothetical protein
MISKLPEDLQSQVSRTKSKSIRSEVSEVQKANVKQKI